MCILLFVPPLCSTSIERRLSLSKHNKRAFSPALAVICILLLVTALSLIILFCRFYNSMNIQTGQAPGSTPSATLSEELETDDIPPEGAALLSQEEAAALAQELRKNAAENELFDDSDVYNILLLGNDSRTNSISERTDVMLLVSINTKTQDILLTSFLRDIYLHIPGYFSHRLNTANALGGPALTVETIEQNFAIDIDRYAEVNFSAFVTIIDTLGGVDLHLTAAEAQTVGCGTGDGTYHLDGEDALSFCRIRSLDNDFGRTERQRELLEALWSDLKSISLPEAYLLMADILPEVTTDLTQSDCLNLLAIGTQISHYSLRSTQIPADDSWNYAMIDGMSVLRLDFEENIDYLRSFIYDQ